MMEREGSLNFNMSSYNKTINIINKITKFFNNENKIT